MIIKESVSDNVKFNRRNKYHKKKTINKFYRWFVLGRRALFLPELLLPVILMCAIFSHFTSNNQELNIILNKASENPRVIDSGNYKPYILSRPVSEYSHIRRKRDLAFDDMDFLKNFDLFAQIQPHYPKKVPKPVKVPSMLPKNKIHDPLSQQRNLWNTNISPDDIRKHQGQNMLKYMDLTEDPCKDFYQYSCGNWHKYHPIPPDHGGFDTFEMLRENLDYQLKQLLEDDADEGAYDEKLVGSEKSLEMYEFSPNQVIPTPYFEEVLKSPKTEYVEPIRKAKFLYKSCMKENIIAQRGAKPLMHLLSELRGWPILEKDWDPSSFDFIWLVAQLRLYNNDILISEWIGPDIKNSDEYVIQLDQTSLGLPSRDYFLSETSREYIEAYHQFLLDIVYILGAPEDQAVNDVKDIIDFEIKLAMITADPEERRNLTNIYARLTLGELQAYVPQFDWIRYFNTVTQRDVCLSTPIVCYCMGYLQELINLLSKTPSRTIANYLLWRFVRHRVNNLDQRFQNAKQKFYHLLFGREASPPRWQFCVAQVNSNLGMALGNLFVNAHFNEKSKNDTILMTKQLEDAFKEILLYSDWLDDVTKTIASAKVDAMRLRIGYPDIILNKDMLTDRYKDIKIHPDYYFENSLSILLHLTRNEHVKIGKLVDKNMWNTAPAIVNAYYSRNKNQIMFPAGKTNIAIYYLHIYHNGTQRFRYFATTFLSRVFSARTELWRYWSGNRSRNNTWFRR